MYIAQSIFLVMLIGSVGITIASWVLGWIAWNTKYLGSRTLVLSDTFMRFGFAASVVSLLAFVASS